MSKPLVSVVIETVTARTGSPDGSLADAFEGALKALDRQTYGRESIQVIVVLDSAATAEEVDEFSRRFPSVKLVSSLKRNYFAAKNVGATAADGELIALLDGDCVPDPHWLEALLEPFKSGAAAVGGRSRYPGGTWLARTFSIPDFAYILSEQNGAASGFNIHNVAFRRELLLTHPFDERIPRDGGCYLLFHQLRAEGARILHEPRAQVTHKLDFQGFGFVSKHFNRGYDGATVYSIDDGAALRGTRLFRRLGAVALLPITGRRIVVDWLRLLRHRRQIGIPFVALPYFGAITVVTRLIELTGGLSASLSRLRSSN